MENVPVMLDPTFIYKQHLDIDSITIIILGFLFQRFEFLLHTNYKYFSANQIWCSLKSSKNRIFRSPKIAQITRSILAAFNTDL